MERLVELTYSIQSMEERIAVMEKKQIELDVLVGTTLEHVQSVRFFKIMQIHEIVEKSNGN